MEASTRLDEISSDRQRIQAVTTYEASQPHGFQRYTLLFLFCRNIVSFFCNIDSISIDRDMISMDPDSDIEMEVDSVGAFLESGRRSLSDGSSDDDQGSKEPDPDQDRQPGPWCLRCALEYVDHPRSTFL